MVIAMGFSQMVVLILIICLPILLLLKLVQKRIQKFELLGLFSLGSLAVILFVTWLQHKILNSPYLMERFALFIVPIFMIALICLFHSIITMRQKIAKVIGVIFICFFAFGTILHFLICGNLTTTSNYSFTTLGTVFSGPGNSVLTIERLFVGQFDNTKYKLNLSDPEGISEMSIMTAGNSPIWGGSPKNGTPPCPAGPINSGTVTLNPSDFPLQGCSHARHRQCR